MTGITTADSACDEAFADRYQSDPNDPSVAQELAVWREAWALARKPYRMYTQILTMQRREEKLVKALEAIAAGERTVVRDECSVVENDPCIDYPGIAIEALAAYRKGAQP